MLSGTATIAPWLFSPILNSSGAGNALHRTAQTLLLSFVPYITTSIVLRMTVLRSQNPNAWDTCYEAGRWVACCNRGRLWSNNACLQVLSLYARAGRYLYQRNGFTTYQRKLSWTAKASCWKPNVVVRKYRKLQNRMPIDYASLTISILWVGNVELSNSNCQEGKHSFERAHVTFWVLLWISGCGTTCKFGQIFKNTHKRPNKIFAAKRLLKTAA